MPEVVQYAKEEILSAIWAGEGISSSTSPIATVRVLESHFIWAAGWSELFGGRKNKKHLQGAPGKRATWATWV